MERGRLEEGRERGECAACRWTHDFFISASKTHPNPSTGFFPFCVSRCGFLGKCLSFSAA